MSIEDPRKKWLKHWHEMIDSELGADPGFKFKAAYKNPSDDFRMHFQTWELPDETLKKCFGILPCGEKMVARAIEMRQLVHSSKMLSEEAAIEYFELALSAMRQLSNEEELNNSLRVVHVSDDEFIERCTHCDSVSVVLESINWGLSPEQSSANSFLTETLYRLASSYDVADYILWPLFPDPDGIEPYRHLAILATSNGYFPLLDEDGPVLFVVDGKR